MSTDAPHLLAASSKQVALTPNMDHVHSPEAPVSVDVLSRTLTAKQFVNFLSEYVNMNIWQNLYFRDRDRDRD